MLHPLLPRLILANAGMHAADQITLIALPLAAVTLFSASPSLVGALVAAQGAAWLIVSLPGGLAVDRFGPFLLAKIAPMIGLLGLLIALFALAYSSPFLLGFSVFLAATGTVLFVLSLSTLIPRLLPLATLAHANGQLELARALVTLATPSCIAWLVDRFSPLSAYLAATIAILLTLSAILYLPATENPPRPRRHPWQEIKEGLNFAWKQPILRGILFCALAWNAAFFALVAVFVPFALANLQLALPDIGLALTGQGAGLLLGALSAGHVISRLQPRLVLIFGPLSSVFGAGLIMVAGGAFALPCAALGYFFIGFGPMLWLVCQTSLRQAVTPPALLGRVNATIQLAIYGVRPLGALLGGIVAEQLGPASALALVIALFILSTVAALVSELARLTHLPIEAGKA